METPKLKIIRDSREQNPYTFQNSKGTYEGVSVESGTLSTGDYALAACPAVCGVERKELSDLMGSISTGRERFEREMERARGYESFAVVCECTWEEVCKGLYRSRMNPKAAAATIASWASKYRITWHFAGSRAAGEYFTFLFLQQFYKRKVAEAKALGLV